MNSKLPTGFLKKPLLEEKLINWEIEFKKELSKIERVKALSKVEKYIIDHLFKKDPSILIYNFNFTIIPDLGKDRARISVAVIFEKTSKQAVPPPKPPGPGPGFEIAEL